MKKLLAGVALVSCIGIGSAYAQTPAKITITSPNFTDGGMIPAKYSCDGEKVNPGLAFSGVPANAKSLALIIDDPDVPKTMIPSGEFVHWIVWDLPATTKSIDEAASAKAPAMGVNGTGKPGYIGMCPPDREHRYFFKVYALDTMLNNPRIANKGELMTAMQGHVIAQGEMMGRYPKKKAQ